MQVKDAAALSTIEEANHTTVTPGDIHATTALGQYVAKAGDLDYAIGSLAEIIEGLRDNFRACQRTLRADAKRPEPDRMCEEDRMRMQTAMTKNAMVLAMNVKQLTEAAKAAGERKKAAERQRSDSFLPGQEIRLVPEKEAGAA